VSASLSNAIVSLDSGRRRVSRPAKQLPDLSSTDTSQLHCDEQFTERTHRAPSGIVPSGAPATR